MGSRSILQRVVNALGVNIERPGMMLRRFSLLSSARPGGDLLESEGPRSSNSEVSRRRKKSAGHSRELDWSRTTQRHVALQVAYLGTRYQGLAAQAHTDCTVEGQLFLAMRKLRLIRDAQPPHFSRSGRTDSGVHAVCQVVSVILRSALPPSEPDGIHPFGSEFLVDGTCTSTPGDALEAMSEGVAESVPKGEFSYAAMLNGVLPPDIRVVGWCPAAADFDARFSCRGRVYRYYFLLPGLDLERMRAAASRFVGQHDFRNFCRMDVTRGESFERTLYSFEINPVSASSEGDAFPCFDSIFAPGFLGVMRIHGRSFLWHQVAANLQNLPVLSNLVGMMRALLTNPNLQVELYLHQFMPALLTCLVGRQLCADPLEDHWSLRDSAARLVAVVCRKFGGSFTTLQPRVTKTLSNAFVDPHRALTTHYGAVVGLSELGPYVFYLLLLPNVRVYCRLLEPELLSVNPVKRMEAAKCHDALLRAVGQFLFRHAKLYSDLVKHSRVSKLSSAAALNAAKQQQQEPTSDSPSTSMESATTVANAGTQTELCTSPKARRGAEGDAGEFDTQLEIFSDLVDRYAELSEIFGEKLLPFLQGPFPGRGQIPIV